MIRRAEDELQEARRSLAEAGRYQESRVMLRKAQQLGTHPDDVGNALQRLKNLEGSDGR